MAQRDDQAHETDAQEQADAASLGDEREPRPRYGGLSGRGREDRRFSDYPRYDGYAGPRVYRHYGYGRRGFRYGAVREAYAAGRDDERFDVQRRFNEVDTDRRRERVLTAHEDALDRGLAHLAASEYREAVAALTLATRLDQGDPASRVHLAQARLALGQFDDAGKILRRALDLQPHLALLPLDLAQQYRAPGEFDAHVDALAAAVRAERVGRDAVFLLGFLEYQRGDGDAAHASLSRLGMQPHSRDHVLRDLLAATRPAGR